MMDMDALPYRPAAGVMLLNREGKVWVGQRLDNTLEAWQMPQGGLDQGEDAAGGRASRARGGDRHRARPGRDPRPLPRSSCYYDLPDDLIGKVWKEQMARPAPDLVPGALPRRGRGRRTSPPPDPEFRAWKWADPPSFRR